MNYHRFRSRRGYWSTCSSIFNFVDRNLFETRAHTYVILGFETHQRATSTNAPPASGGARGTPIRENGSPVRKYFHSVRVLRIRTYSLRLDPLAPSVSLAVCARAKFSRECCLDESAFRCAFSTRAEILLLILDAVGIERSFPPIIVPSFHPVFTRADSDETDPRWKIGGAGVGRGAFRGDHRCDTCAT